MLRKGRNASTDENMGKETIRKQRSKRATSFGKNVLIVEDDPDTAHTIQCVLAMEGYGARSVKNRDDAVEAARHNLYQFVLMDYAMPGMSAEEFLTQVKRVSPVSTVVLITAGTRARNVARQLGVSNWIAKPFAPQELVAALKTSA